jgi:two-component system LytT family response regulator
VKYSVVVVDDEPLAREGLAALVASDPEFDVIGRADDGPSAVRTVLGLRPDILVLDIQLPEFDGFEVLRRVQGRVSPVVVFVTGYDAHAVRAFEVSATDYVLKPFTDRRFRESLARAKARGPAVASRLVVKDRDRTILLPVDAIEWVEAADYYVLIHTHGRTYVLRETMTRIERRLDRSRFCRIHRSAIVNLDRVQEIRAAEAGGQVVLLSDGSVVPVAPARKAHLQARLRPRV